MDTSLPGIVVTGASGFIGRNFVESVVGRFRLFCLARRSPEEVGIQSHDNILWTQVDIEDWPTLLEVVQYIKNHGGADYVLHLAGYYDFSQKDNPEYERTNVRGTRNILKLAELIEAKRFLFSSSLAACKFPSERTVVNEESPADAKFPYARSKRIGEEMMKEYSEKFPCTIIRLAAVYSDWCEYPPLYVFLHTWLSHKWNARILGGYGESSVTYIHIHDLIKLFVRIIDIDKSLPRFCTYIASPSGSISHRDIFRTATRYYYGQDVEPILVPRPLAAIGIVVRCFWGKYFGKEPFERPWMIEYIDKILNVDASATHKALSWKPTPRYQIMRRLLFLIEKIKHYSDEWTFRNEMLLERVAQRPSIMIYHIMIESRQDLVDKALAYVLTPRRHRRFGHYQRMDENLLKWYISLFYLMIAATIRKRDRQLMHSYTEIITSRRFAEGFTVKEVSDLLLTIGNIVSDELLSKQELKGMEQQVYDYITLTIQLAIDEIEDFFEMLEVQTPGTLPRAEEVHLAVNSNDMKGLMRQLEDICDDSLDDFPSAGSRGFLDTDFKERKS